MNSENKFDAKKKKEMSFWESCGMHFRAHIFKGISYRC